MISHGGHFKRPVAEVRVGSSTRVDECQAEPKCHDLGRVERGCVRGRGHRESVKADCVTLARRPIDSMADAPPGTGRPMRLARKELSGKTRLCTRVSRLPGGRSTCHVGAHQLVEVLRENVNSSPLPENVRLNADLPCMDGTPQQRQRHSHCIYGRSRTRVKKTAGVTSRR